ncbi:LINE-1 retrotransposable element ORF2 protein [Cucumis melo var. makuwa]|uniref:LINE-1 retrotransposable element ORF2 protein n=1 Tax=Cucumis melo var. makuwa TaxID=1194695 RepID=A0A5D3DS76_CUCMM|nr:LINE-1 retrotransposable element ORF2 protein [Cucumis melo var. makuwa]TYK26358.1 LINE-1 retrotransposable element ORF2 protein [Cucumis melo var. makuwa]
MDYLRLLTNLEQKGKMKGVNFEGSFNLSHILFADDIVLFSEDNDEDISNLRESTIWRFLTEKKALWRRLICAKYNQAFVGDFPTKGSFGSTKSPWRLIIEGNDWFLPHIAWKINNGETVSFWNGFWHEKSPLATFAPRLFALSNIQQGSVKDHWRKASSDWNFQPRRPMRSHEVHLWDVPETSFSAPDQSRGEDCPIWKFNSSGAFDIASIKKALLNDGHHDVASISPSTFKNLWQSDIPKTGKFFIWSLLHECLNTMISYKKDFQIGVSILGGALCANATLKIWTTFLHLTPLLMASGIGWQIWWAGSKVPLTLWHYLERNNRIFNNLERSTAELWDDVKALTADEGAVWVSAW